MSEIIFPLVISTSTLFVRILYQLGLLSYCKHVLLAFGRVMLSIYDTTNDVTFLRKLDFDPK